MGRTGEINAQVRATKSSWNFSQWTHAILDIGPQTHVSGRFRPFHCYTNFGVNLERTHQIHPIGPYTYVLGHFGPFRYCMNFGVKGAKLVQLMHKFMKPNRAELGSLMNKFVQRCHAGFFRNKVIRSTPLDPRLMFWGITDRSVTARFRVQIGPNWGH
jgi:hypothetical protein